MDIPFLKNIVPGHAPELRESMWKSILLSLEDALFLYNSDFTIVFWNHAAEGLFAIDEEEALGHVITPKDVADTHWRLVGQVVFPSLAPTMISRSEPGADQQIVDLSFPEPYREFRVLTSPVADEQGKPFGFLKIIKDRTEEAASIKSKSDFLELAAHQLRSPITNIKWALETLLQDSSITDDSKTFVQGALDASQELLQVANDLLSVSRAEGSENYHFEEIDVVPFLEAALSPILPAARHANVNLYLDRPKETLPHVMIDKEKIAMVLANILDNAIRYNVKNGEVVVSVTQDAAASPPVLAVHIKDTGIGIPHEAVEKVSGKFFRADNARHYQANGSGLGLYIAKNIIEGHGGRLGVSSEINRGTEVTFTLPTDFRFIPGYRGAGTDELPQAQQPEIAASGNA